MDVGFLIDYAKWATTGVVPGGLAAAGSLGLKIGGERLGNPLVIGGKAAILGAVSAYSIATILDYEKLPGNLIAAGAAGAVTGAGMASGLATSYTWLAGDRYTRMTRDLPAVALRGMAVGVVAGAVIAPLIVANRDKS
jgi:hypothetical protein